MLPPKSTGKYGNLIRYPAIAQLLRNKFSIIFLSFIAFSVPSAAQTAGVGTGQTYANLNDAITAVNNGLLTGTVRLEIRSNITQTATATLNASGTGAASYSTLTIYPTGNYSIIGNINGPLLELAGCQRVSIDGKLNANPAGAAYSLSLENTNTGTNASLVRVRDGGSQTLIQNAVLKGAGGSATRAMINFDGTGNMANNILQYCRVTNSGGNRPYSACYANATGASTSVIVFGNEVFDIFRPDAGTKAIVVTGTVSVGYIMNNHIYETAPVNATGTNHYRGISVEGADATSVLVQGNYIGGSQINAGGSPMTFTSASDPQFDAIYISGGTAAAPASVQGNTVTNISFQSSRNIMHNIYSPGYFNAVYISGSDVYANIGTETGNTIGSQTATGVIQLFPTNTSAYCPAVMIYNDATGTVNIVNNKIGGINATGAAVVKSFIGILDAGATGIRNITGNTIGSAVTANSIHIGPNSFDAPVNELVWGIANLSFSGDISITGNTIAHITQESAGPNINALKHVAGIFLVTGGNVVVNDNTMHHLVSYADVVAGGEFSNVVGIDVFQNMGNIQSISGNKIYELQSLHPGNLTTEVTGILFKGNSGNSILRNNFIHSLRLASSNTLAKINGINMGIANGVGLVSNNVISLGAGVSTGYVINGIYDGSQYPGNAHKYYYNTISLSGNAGTGSNSAALNLASNTPSARELINNILVNERNNTAGTAKHYALFVTGTPVLTANYNNYYTPNAGGIPGYFSGDKTTLPVVTGQDVSSSLLKPGFINPGGTDAIDYIPTRFLPGEGIAGYEPDFLGMSRPASPYMGAFHYISVLPVTWLDFTLGQGDQQIMLKWSTVNEYFSKDFVIEHSENGTDWKNIGVVPAAGNSNTISRYQFIHVAPSQNRNYYRIQQRDIDGNFSYSKIRITETKKGRGVQVLSNPVQGGMLEFKSNQPELLSLIAPDGRMVWRKQFAAGQHQESMQMLPAGTYYLRSATEVITIIKK